MGIYINPPDLTSRTPFKEEFILQAVRDGKAERVSVGQFVAHEPGKDGVYGVAWVHNGAFDALGVAFDANEARAFSDAGGRPVMYFLVHEDTIRDWHEHAYRELMSWTKRSEAVS